MSITQAQRRATLAVREWCTKQGIELVAPPAHIQPTAYVIGYAAPSCLIISVPWTNSEPQVRDMDRRCPLATVHTFDKSLHAGDWCISAYISAQGRGERIAIPLQA